MPDVNIPQQDGSIAYDIIRALLVACAWLAIKHHFKAAKEKRKPANNVAAFEEFFRGNLHGHWDTCQFSVCPADTAVSFFKDGTGQYSAGPAGMLGGPTDFKWRQIGDFEIELSIDGHDPWTKVTYSFGKLPDGPIKILFDVEEPSREGTEWIYDFAWDAIPFVGLSN